MKSYIMITYNDIVYCAQYLSIEVEETECLIKSAV